MGNLQYMCALSLVILVHYGETQKCSYTALENSLIETEENKYELSKTFFPPINNPPDFVTVYYNFSETNERAVWYWSAFTSSFIHPPEVLQFMSLFFAKPHGFYTDEIDITLSNTSKGTVAECSNDLQKMQLLTQRLQLYATQQTSPLKVDSTYSAKAFVAFNMTISEELRVTFEQSTKDNISALVNLTILAIIILVILTVVIILTIFMCSKQDDWEKMIKKRISVVISLAVISPIISIYNLILSSFALNKWITMYKDDSLYMLHRERNAGPISITIAVDALAFLLCISIVVASAIKCKSNVDTTSTASQENTRNGTGSVATTETREGVTSNQSTTTEPVPSQKETCASICKPFTTMQWHVILSFMILAPIVSVISHSPYIAIAYLNDGNHAGSIFIYYTIIFCIAYSICWISYHPLESVLLKSVQRQSLSKLTNCIVITLGLLGLTFFIGLVVITSVYFVIIPINKSISDAPNRLIGIYQSGGFLIASFVLYKLIGFFYRSNRKTNLEKAVLQMNNTTDNRPDEDKLNDFYTIVVRIITDESRGNG